MGKSGKSGGNYCCSSQLVGAENKKSFFEECKAACGEEGSGRGDVSAREISTCILDGRVLRSDHFNSKIRSILRVGPTEGGS